MERFKIKLILENALTKAGITDPVADTPLEFKIQSQLALKEVISSYNLFGFGSAYVYGYVYKLSTDKTEFLVDEGLDIDVEYPELITGVLYSDKGGREDNWIPLEYAYSKRSDKYGVLGLKFPPGRGYIRLYMKYNIPIDIQEGRQAPFYVDSYTLDLTGLSNATVEAEGTYSDLIKVINQNTSYYEEPIEKPLTNSDTGDLIDLDLRDEVIKLVEKDLLPKHITDLAVAEGKTLEITENILLFRGVVVDSTAAFTRGSDVTSQAKPYNQTDSDGVSTAVVRVPITYTAKYSPKNVKKWFADNNGVVELFDGGYSFFITEIAYKLREYFKLPMSTEMKFERERVRNEVSVKANESNF